MSQSKNVLIITAVACGVAALYFLAWQLMFVLATAFAAVLVATFLRTGGWILRQVTPLNEKPAMAVFMVLLLVVVVGGIWLAAGPVAEQGQQLVKSMPKAVDQALKGLKDTPVGGLVADDLADLLNVSDQTDADATPNEVIAAATRQATTEPSEDVVSAESTSPAGALDLRSLARRVLGVVYGVFGALVAVALVTIVGIYMAFDPGLYVRGFAWLFPEPTAGRIQRTCHELGETLRWWLLGQLSSMAVVGVLSYIALKILGINLALILALLTFILVFIPNFGPILSAIPPALLAMMQGAEDGGGGMSLALWVLGAYLLIQVLESYLITPMIQKKAVSLPPALLILMQLLMGTLLGALGVALAAPLAAVGITGVKEMMEREEV